MAKIRPLGDILLDAEKLIDEAIDHHGLQFGDILGLIYAHLLVHRPDAREEYVADDSHPEYYYGPRRK